MITSCLTLRAKFTSIRIAMATLVSGPMARIVTCPGFCITVETRKSTAPRVSAFLLVAKPPGGWRAGSLAYQPPCRLVSHSVPRCINGAAAPWNTGISLRPVASSTFSASAVATFML